MSNKIDFKERTREVLLRLPFPSTHINDLGIKVAESTPSSEGWLATHNPYKPDKNPSAGINVGSGPERGYLVTFNNAGGLSSAVSFWDLVRDLHPTLSGAKFYDILKHYAKKYGVDLNTKKAKPPKQENVEFYQKSLTKEIRAYLKDHRGLSAESIEKYKIGWSSRRERLTYPVFDSHGALVNIRFHAWKKDQKPKTQNWGGHGGKRLWGIDRLTAAPDEAVVAVTVGEWDSILIEQETGLISVSPTNGDQAFDSEWTKAFSGKHVVLVCDCDTPCRLAVAKRFVPAFRIPVRNGDVLSFKIVWLFDDPKNKSLKDATDYFVKAGGSGQALLDIIEKTKPEEFPLPSTDLPDPVVLDSFKEIDNPDYVGKRVSFPLYIHGENSEAYHAPTRVFVGECPGKNKKGCHGRDDWEWGCDEPIPIRTGDRIQLACVSSNDFQMKGYLREYVCDKGNKPVINLENEDRITIREVYAHQVISGNSDTELVEKPVYTIGGKIYSIGQYQAIGFIHSHPRNQKPTMLIDTMEAQEEDWQAFNIDKARPLLRELQVLDIMDWDILKDLTYHVTKIYKRYDLHLGVLLNLCSPKWIDFPGDGRIRGWISAVIIGDTGTGKSETTEKIYNYAGVGYRVSGMTSSRTGITYACEYDEKRGWRIKAGALLKMSGQAIIIDEAQDLAEEDLKTMAEAIERGRLKIDRIQNKEFEAETRSVFLCNPVNPKRRSDQRTMSSYKYGCRSVGDIFPKMMLRRLDLILFAASNDIKDKNKIFNQPKPKNLVQVVSPENLKALIYYAWNLPPEKIIIPDDIVKSIREESSILATKFGGGEDLPIVYPEDFRKTFCRMCVACAVIDLSSDDDFESITVKQIHVGFMSDRLNEIYAHKNCQLDKHSVEYEHENTLDNEHVVAERLRIHLLDFSGDRTKRFTKIFNELLQLDPSNKKEKLSTSYLKDILDVSRRTIFDDIKPLIEDRLIISSRGYLPTPKLFQLWHYLNDLPKGHEHHNLINLNIKDAK